MNKLRSVESNSESDQSAEMEHLIRQLYPICRSITGNGVRQTLKILQEVVPLTIHEVPSGTAVFDWTIPKEWNITDAYIKNSNGVRIADFRKSNLHVVSYSTPLKRRVSLAELKKHVFTIPERPDWIPYRTSYYNESWGFCLSHRQLLDLCDQEYEVHIDSTLTDGYLNYGEYYLKGATDDEVLMSTHMCHPSLANDNLSGIAVAICLAKRLGELPLRYSYRFLFVPGTIGSITWLSNNKSFVEKIKHGLIVTGLGDGGRFTYKKSRRGDAEIDRAAIQVLKHSGKDYKVVEFSPYGYDERQYCSPGFNLPVGCFMRSPPGEYPEYHTSADNLDFVQGQYLQESFQHCLKILLLLERNGTFLNQNPHCEPQLGRRGLYRRIGGQAEGAKREMAMLWALNLSDGNHTLLDIAERSNTPFDDVYDAAETLLAYNLLQECPAESNSPSR
jgi:aminopeptidase-like protein